MDQAYEGFERGRTKDAMEKQVSPGYSGITVANGRHT